MDIKYVLAAFSLVPALACTAVETNVTPVECADDPSRCTPGGFICARIALEEGTSNPICVEPVGCGGLECGSGECGSIDEIDPDPAETFCIVEVVEAGTPVPCAGAGDCPTQWVCVTVETEEGTTNPVCAEPADCGGLECASGACAELPEGGELACVVEELA
jgi:hypothetical protein